MSNRIKVMLMLRTKQKKEFAVASDINVIFFWKKIVKRWIKFLQCPRHCWCCADNDFQDNDFYDITFKEYIWYIVQRNDWYSSKENRVSEIHLNKHYKTCKDREMYIKHCTPKYFHHSYESHAKKMSCKV